MTQADTVEEENIAQKLNGALSSFIVPCKNEEEMLPVFYDEFLRVMKLLGEPNFELIFVEDGSTDKSMQVIRNLALKDERVKYISFSRNFGKEAAMLAGLKKAKGEYIAILDADLQDPPSFLPQMYTLLQDPDCDCVATKRITRTGEGILRSFLSDAFYKCINKFSSVKLVQGARDFRLMKRHVLDAILSLPEQNRFIKGIYEWVGFNTKWIEFENHERKAGKTKWSMFQLFLYAVDGITAFSVLPLALASILGISFCLVSAVALIFIVVRQLIFHNSVAGWASMMSVIVFIGGLQLLCLGIIGQYLSKAYIESKHRPKYIIKDEN